MALVNYPSDSEDDNDDYVDTKNSAAKDSSALAAKRKRSTSPPPLPPLPQSFHDLYTTNVRQSTSDDPSLHGGRKRVTPHVQGNWPTHVYIEWHLTHSQSQLLQTLVPSSPEVKSLLYSELDAPLPLHISLSRSLNFTADEREPFISRLRDEVARSGVPYFQLALTGLTWVPNFEGTRWFLVLTLTELGSEEQSAAERYPRLSSLLDACNTTAVAFKQPWLYVPARRTGTTGRRAAKVRRGEKAEMMNGVAGKAKDPSENFHISIAWSLHEVELTDGNAPVAELVTTSLKDLHVPVTAVKAKVGNQITVLDLDATTTKDNRSFLG